MKLLFQISFFLLAWFTNIVNATPVFTKIGLPCYEIASSDAETGKEKRLVKIGELNFARSDIENRKQFSSISKGEIWRSIACSKEQEKIVQGAGKEPRSAKSPDLAEE